MIYHLKRVAKWRLDTGNKLLKNLGRKRREEFYTTRERRPFRENSIHGKKEVVMKMFERIIFDVFLMILVEARVRIFMRNTCNFAFDSPNKLTKCFGCLFSQILQCQVFQQVLDRKTHQNHKRIRESVFTFWLCCIVPF